MSEHKWQERMFCNKCDWSAHAPNGPFFVIGFGKVCPDCGIKHWEGRYPNKHNGYTMKTVRWVEGEVIEVDEWWKFNKQAPGHWEERDKNDA